MSHFHLLGLEVLGRNFAPKQQQVVKFPKAAEAFKSSSHFILGVRLAINRVGTKCRVGEGSSGVARLNLNHQDSSAGLVFWWASCSHSAPIYIEKQQQEGGRGERWGRWASALMRVGCEWKAKAYQNTREVRSFIQGLCPCSLIRTSPSMLWVSILNTKHLSTLLTGTLISTSQHFSTFTTRLVANQSVICLFFTALYVSSICSCLLSALWPHFFFCSFALILFVKPL